MYPSPYLNFWTLTVCLTNLNRSPTPRCFLHLVYTFQTQFSILELMPNIMHQAFRIIFKSWTYILFRYKQTNPGSFRFQTYRKLHVINTKNKKSFGHFLLHQVGKLWAIYSFRSQCLSRVCWIGTNNTYCT